MSAFRRGILICGSVCKRKTWSSGIDSVKRSSRKGEKCGDKPSLKINIPNGFDTGNDFEEEPHSGRDEPITADSGKPLSNPDLTRDIC